MKIFCMYRELALGSFTVFASLLLLVPALNAKETIVDPANGFSLTLPDGFNPNPQLAEAAPNILHAFVKGDPNDDELDVILFIEKMRGTIGRERLQQEDLSPGSSATLFTAKWQGFEVDGFEVPERLGEIETTTYNVQIPLKGAAIQLKLFGSADRRSEMDGVLKELLAGLTGESNWMPSASEATPAASSDDYVKILLAGVVMIVLGGLFMLFFISRWAPKGTVLAIAAAIYLSSYALGGSRVREVMMLSGAMRMLGFAGCILGIVDLVRKRKTNDQTAH